jgi:hypothetical protein
MSTDLPYFKFFTSEWLNGDIVLESYETQGIFINLCSYYWHKECNLELSLACKKLRISKDEIQFLIESNLINIIDEQIIEIKFLNEQYELFKSSKQKLSDAGKKGAYMKSLSKVSAQEQPPLNNPSALREEKRIENKINLSSTTVKIDYENLLLFFNQMFSKNCKVVPTRAKQSYQARLKEGFTKECIINSMKNVKQDKWHKENNYKYATIMYFSTAKTLDSYSNSAKVKSAKYNAHEQS